MLENGFINGISRFIDESTTKSLFLMAEEIERAENLDFNSLDKDQTVVIIVDMINGFAKEGILSSGRVEALIPGITTLLAHAEAMNKVFVCDAHPLNAAEFQSYPPHAIDGSYESAIVDELLPYIDQRSRIIKKNSTNAMMATEMRSYLLDHWKISNFILVGDCTDICILQCALGLKSYFNEMNKVKRIIVPHTLVDTYDLDVTNHNATLMNLFALYNMKINGIEIIKNIIF